MLRWAGLASRDRISKTRKHISASRLLPSIRYAARPVSTPLNPLQDCCENCWDSEGKTRGIEGYSGVGVTTEFRNKIRGLEAFSRCCQSPSERILSPLCLPFHHPGDVIFQPLIGLTHL